MKRRALQVLSESCVGAWTKVSVHSGGDNPSQTCLDVSSYAFMSRMSILVFGIVLLLRSVHFGERGRAASRRPMSIKLQSRIS